LEKGGPRELQELLEIALNLEKCWEQEGRDVWELWVALFERESGLYLALADLADTTMCAKTKLGLHKIVLQLQELELVRGEFADTRWRCATRRATAGKVMAAKRLRDRLRPHVFKALDQHPTRKWTIAQVLQRIPADAYESESASLSTLRRRVDDLMKEHASAQGRADQGS
jgi:hypothetical protein